MGAGLGLGAASAELASALVLKAMDKSHAAPMSNVGFDSGWFMGVIRVEKAFFRILGTQCNE
jgi:hypothetical protein